MAFHNTAWTDIVYGSQFSCAELPSAITLDIGEKTGVYYITKSNISKTMKIMQLICVCTLSWVIYFMGWQDNMIQYMTVLCVDCSFDRQLVLIGTIMGIFSPEFVNYDC